MVRYCKKPIVVEAWQWKGSGLQADAPSWILAYRDINNIQVKQWQDGTLTVPTLEGLHIASIGDWIIRGIKGEIYPCKPDIFEATYEEVYDGTPSDKE